MYKVIKGKNGVRYALDGKFVSKSSIPKDILIKLNVGMEVDEKPVEQQTAKCIFCNTPTKIIRFLNMQSIPICEEHYYSMNVGQTVQRFNEVHKHENETAGARDS